MCGGAPAATARRGLANPAGRSLCKPNFIPVSTQDSGLSSACGILFAACVPRDLLALEFPRICTRLADFAASEVGKDACRALEPSADRSAAEQRLERTAQTVQLTTRQGNPPLAGFPDIRPHLRTAAHEGFVLDGPALVEIRTTIAMAREVQAFFRRHLAAVPALADVPVQVETFPMLESSLTRALDEQGRVVDGASDELARVRQAIRRLREALTRRLEDLVSRASMSDVVSDTFVTIRNNRFVIPVRVSMASRLGGVVQDRSISGETLFVEPLFAVELNNELLVAVREEEAIVRRILADLTALVRSEHERIDGTFHALVGVDCLLAQAKFARAFDCTVPQFDAPPRSACHPRDIRAFSSPVAP